jgi:hypothetical protein
MHLTEVGGALRTRSDADARLALIFPKGQVAKARRPRLSEFLSKEELRPYFRIQESKIRASEKVFPCPSQSQLPCMCKRIQTAARLTCYHLAGYVVTACRRTSLDHLHVGLAHRSIPIA